MFNFVCNQNNWYHMARTKRVFIPVSNLRAKRGLIPVSNLRVRSKVASQQHAIERIPTKLFSNYKNNMKQSQDVTQAVEYDEYFINKDKIIIKNNVNSWCNFEYEV